MPGATENGGHPWNGETLTLKIEDPGTRSTLSFEAGSSRWQTRHSSSQEPVLLEHNRPAALPRGHSVCARRFESE